MNEGIMQASVSVIIPCFRAMLTIDRALQSVANQTLLPLEVILVDDFSQDGTLSHLESLSKAYPSGWVKVVQLNFNEGPGSARNAGWRIARGDYLAFLDADDSWHPKKLEIQYEYMKQHQTIALTGHNTKRVEKGSQCSSDIGDFVVRTINPTRLLFSNPFPTRTVMLRRSLDFRFADKKRFSEDYLLWLQIALNGHETAKFESILAYSYKSDFGEGGLSANLWEHEQGELNTLSRIFKEGLISSMLFVLAASFSLLKFLRRLLLNFLFRRAVIS